MNKIIMPKIYFVIFISAFIVYIYLQNIRINNQFESNFSCDVTSSVIDKCVSDKISTITAVITSEPYQKGSSMVYKIDGISIYFGIGDDVLVGDKVEVVGNLEKRLIKPGYIDKRLISRDFRYISRGKDESHFSSLRWLYNLSILSKHLRSVVDMHLPPTQSKLLAGILFGSRENIPITLYENLINTGTIHIIAASGYNISIIAGFVMSVFSKLFKKKVAILLAIISIASFVVVSGGGEAVVRAAIMGVIAFGAQYFGKLYTSLYSLGLTIVIMMFLKPALVSNVSFQLSVSSTLGILLIGGKLNHLFNNKFRGESLLLASKKNLRAALMTFYYDLSTTLSATVATLPVILVHFDRISIITLLVNMLVLWVVPPVMFFGFILVVLGLFSGGLASVWSYLLMPFLMYFTRVISWFGGLSFASYELTWFNGYMLFGYYAVLLSLTLLKSGKMPINE